MMTCGRIVLFTANTQGGIIQYTLQMYKTLCEQKYEAILCLPETVTDTDLSKIDQSNLVFYQKSRKVLDMRSYKKIAAAIAHVKPDAVWYTDDSVICSLVGLHLPRHIDQLVTMHDAGRYHPSNHVSVREFLMRIYKQTVNCAFYRRVKRFVLLSKESEECFRNRFAAQSHKVVLNQLGAHLPDAEPMRPGELNADFADGYLLFFGRIDKYKGIGRLLEAYREVSDRAPSLVIAGGGKFSDEEKNLIGRLDNLHVLNRYIQDGEMLWLFRHCAAVILPYIEATQSGVIPIAYHFGKPVVVSDVKGLTQFVAAGKTGMICENSSQWKRALVDIAEFAPNAVEDIRIYYHREMDWSHNLKAMMKKV